MTQKKETLLVSNTHSNRTKNMIFLCFIMGIFNQMEGKSIGKILKKEIPTYKRMVVNNNPKV